ncbi:Uu.00g051810.m01.CDS01 [Anthostomella pinea]|uniref:Uu.00g051810.m01.CDS01 n=1 Tax=Anthostomella pinea TaxID=933095 RepID=A0AAI8VW56_9PEZI|nr:Uu.00g051810.m01.CDS01 [Anthostomella pinea]
MAEAASSSAGGDQHAADRKRLSMHQPAGAVEMEDLSQVDPTPANPDTKITQDHDAEDRPIPVPEKDIPVAETSSKAQGKARATGEDQDLTIDPVESPGGDAKPALGIMLLLPTGARHPFRIDEKYLTKRNVTVTDLTEDGKVDPSSITVYTLKELILRDWRREWDDPPREPTSIRLIHFGKMLSDRDQLSHYNFSQTANNIVHMTVKPQDLIDEEEAAKQVKTSSHGGRSGCCVIL